MAVLQSINRPMSSSQPAMSKISDTAATAKARYQAMFPGTPTKTTAPKNVTATGSTTKAQAQPKVSAPKTTTKKSTVSDAEKKYQEQINKAIKESFAQGEQFLGSQEARLQAALPETEAQIAAAYEAQVPELQRAGEEQARQIQTQQEETRAQRESALAEARRQYEQGLQRGQTLFGGVGGSSAGLAQSELLSRELARQTGATTRAAEQQISGLSQNLRDVEAQTQQQLRQLQLDKQSAVQKARDAFRQQLDTIAGQRFQLTQDKANRQLQALQDFNQRRRQLEDYFTQQQDAIQNLRTQAQINLENYVNQLQAAQRFSPQANPISNLASANLELLQTSNPEYAKRLAQEIASSAALMQAYKARRNEQGDLEYVTSTGNIKVIPLQ